MLQRRRYVFFRLRRKREVRFKSDNWPMARSALDLVISEAPVPNFPDECPRLEIWPNHERIAREMNVEGAEE